MIFRKANSEDIDRIVPLWQGLSDLHAELEPMFEMVGDASEKYKKHLHTSMQRDSFHVIVAEDGEMLAGYGIISLSIRPEVFVKQKSATIQDVYVHSEYRKKGIGKGIVNELIRFADEKKVEMINLSATVGNDTANIFWKQVGFTPTLNFMTRYSS